MARQKPPMQPIGFAKDGVIRFQRNHVVRTLLDEAEKLGFDLNRLYVAVDDLDVPERDKRADYDQFLQLIGYSVSGAPLKNRALQAEADAIADRLSKSRRRKSRAAFVAVRTL